ACAAAPTLTGPAAEAWTNLTNFHEDPARLDRARDLLQSEVERTPTLETLVLLSWAHLAWADYRATTPEAKLASYERGRDVAPRAEGYFRRALALDAHFTRARVELARCLIQQGRYGEAREELQRVVDEERPSYRADWVVRHRPTAQRLLGEIRAKSYTGDPNGHRRPHRRARDRRRRGRRRRRLAARARRHRRGVPGARRLGRSPSLSSLAGRLGAPPAHRLERRAQRAAATSGLSSQRQRLVDLAADVQRRGREH